MKPRWSIVEGNCVEVLKRVPDGYVDATATDPPYSLKFMGAVWDDPKNNPATSVALWREVLRVLKPGSHVVAFGGTRTHHRIVVAMEDAGFQIRDSIHWITGQGFPKSVDIAKAIDESAGAEREVIGINPSSRPNSKRRGGRGFDSAVGKGPAGVQYLTAPATDLAHRFEGFGTALKPSHEPIVLARKPPIGTIAQNVEAFGTGGINVDGCRVAADPEDFAKLAAGVEAVRQRGGVRGNSWKNTSDLSGANPANPAGRWPPNVVLTHSAACGDQCAPGCPVAALGRQSGERRGMSGGGKHRADYPGGMFGGIDSPGTARGDTGTAARFFPRFRWDDDDFWPFFYSAKATVREREAGCERIPFRNERERKAGRRNVHPTVKPLALMRWLLTLVAPPGDPLILDPFAGSGTTIAAAKQLGIRAAGIELDPHFCRIARARLDFTAGGTLTVKGGQS